MKKYSFLAIACVIMLALFSACKSGADHRALIITGQNNHNWKVTTPIFKVLLEQTGIFSVDVAVSPDKGGDMNKFTPKFSNYEVIVLNYSGDSWSEKTKSEFIEFVKNGGGVVVVHAADNSFPDWPAYSEMIGLGWGRTEKDGPFVYFKGDKMVIDTTAGPSGGHGERQEFTVRNRNTQHPITKGLPPRWMHGKDELYSKLRGPAKNMEILATAFAPPGKGGTGRDEPILIVTNYGKGRIFHTVLGHGDVDGGPAIQCAGFIVTLQRGTEWAATGQVTQKVPYDFPTAAGTSLRVNYQEMTLEDDLIKIGGYDITKSTKYFVDLQSRIRAEGTTPEKRQQFEHFMIELLENKAATDEGKKLILRELSWMGSDLSIPVITKLLQNPALKDDAKFALARLQPTK
jgi:type 1 glutamine amidotransferase